MSGVGLVDEDRVDFVDDGVHVSALHLVGQSRRHVVAQVVEAELVVRAVGDVAGVVSPFERRLLAVARDHQPDAEAEEVVDPTHPFGVEPSEVVVHGDDAHARPESPLR